MENIFTQDSEEFENIETEWSKIKKITNQLQETNLIQERAEKKTKLND